VTPGNVRDRLRLIPVGTLPKRLGVLVSRTSRILNARTLDELVGETADAARRILRAARAVAFIQTEDAQTCSGASPRWDAADTAEPTRAIPLVGRDGQRLGALQVWTREGTTLSQEDEQVLLQIAHCAATVADGSLTRSPSGQDASVLTRFARTVHDLRTPLTAMLSWTWALKHGLDGPRATRAYDAIERNALTQARILDEVAEALRASLRANADAGMARESLRPSEDGASPQGEKKPMERLGVVMTTGVETVAPGDTIRFAAEKMDALDVGSLPVCDGERLVGMVTDRDLAVRAVASGRDPNRTAVVEAMTPDLVYALEEQGIDDAVELMREHEIRRLPVVDDSHRLVGIVALADLATRTGASIASEALEGVSKPRLD
jgi:CBS domain-containing protein